MFVDKWDLNGSFVHYVKSFRTRSYSGPYFAAFGLNTERYGVSLCIQSECGKILTRIAPNTNTFHAVVMTLHLPLVKLLEVFLSQVEKELFELPVSHLGYSNFTREEWTAIRSLADDHSIIITNADKDSCVVVWDRPYQNDWVCFEE